MKLVLTGEDCIPFHILFCHPKYQPNKITCKANFLAQKKIEPVLTCRYNQFHLVYCCTLGRLYCFRHSMYQLHMTWRVPQYCCTEYWSAPSGNSYSTQSFYHWNNQSLVVHFLLSRDTYVCKNN